MFILVKQLTQERNFISVFLYFHNGLDSLEKLQSDFPLNTVHVLFIVGDSKRSRKAQFMIL